MSEGGNVVSTNAGILFFGSYPQQHIIQAEVACVLFRETIGASRYADRKFITGTLQELIDGAEAFLNRYIAVGARVEWLPLDRPFGWDMLRVRVEKMSSLDAVGTAQLLDYAWRGAWMFEYYVAMYFSRDYFLFPYVVGTIVLDEQGKPLSHPKGDGFGWWALIPQLLMR